MLLSMQHGYYEDFEGLADLASACREGLAVSGRRSAHRRRHGNSARNIPLMRFIVYAENHDQIGNRLTGDRLASTISFEEQKLALASVLLAPAVPMLFMGEEYGETAPFQY